MRITTHQDAANAIARLKRRPADVLAAFIVALAQDTGPVGEQVRTFIVGDNLDETAAALKERLSSLELPSEYEHRHALGREIGAHLQFILDSIETLVMPADPARAFALLVAFFESDSVAMEHCGDHDWEVQCEFERASVLMAAAVKSVPRDEAVAAIKQLLDNDGYGVRGRLLELIAGEDDES